MPVLLRIYMAAGRRHTPRMLHLARVSRATPDSTSSRLFRVAAVMLRGANVNMNPIL